MACEIKITYYASLREKANRSEEFVLTNSQTAKDLFLELSNKYHFSLKSNQVRVAINDEFKDMDASLKFGDEVVFIPPVAGG